MKYRAYDIKYDTCGLKIASLPQELQVELDDDQDPSLDLADAVSDMTGWCVFSLSYEEIDNTNTPQVYLE